MSNNGTISGYIDDGYTKHGYIAERKHLHPAVRFSYRPALIHNRSVIFRKIQTTDNPKEEELIAARAVCNQIVEWNLKDRENNAVPVHVDHALRVEPNLITRLFQIVMGTDVTDEDPQWSQSEQEHSDADLEAALSEGGLSQIEEQSAKN